MTRLVNNRNTATKIKPRSSAMCRFKKWRAAERLADSQKSLKCSHELEIMQNFDVENFPVSTFESLNV